MSKIVIKESDLNRLIMESINEELESEGWLSNLAGRAYEWGKNKFNNMRNDFNAGRYQYLQNRTARQPQGDGVYQPNGGQGGPQEYPDLATGQGTQPEVPPTTQNTEQPAATTAEQPTTQNTEQPTAQTRKPGARQTTATNFMTTLRAGQPALVTQSVKNYLTRAINAYSQTHPNAVSNNYFRKLSNQVGKIRIGEYLNPQDVNVRSLSTLFNEFARQQNWALRENRIRKIVAESLRKFCKRSINEAKKNSKNGKVRLTESQVEQIVMENVVRVLRESMNEVGDTKKGQKQLGRLSAKRFVQYDDAIQNDDREKATDCANRHFAANNKAKKESGKAEPSRSFKKGFKAELKKQRGR